MALDEFLHFCQPKWQVRIVTAFEIESLSEKNIGGLPVATSHRFHQKQVQELVALMIGMIVEPGQAGPKGHQPAHFNHGPNNTH